MNGVNFFGETAVKRLITLGEMKKTEKMEMVELLDTQLQLKEKRLKCRWFRAYPYTGCPIKMTPCAVLLKFL